VRKTGKNLHKLDRVPEKLKESIFLQLFETAETSKFNQQEYEKKFKIL
jgi:hypothetical protein